MAPAFVAASTNERHLPGRDHAGLVENEDSLVVELVAALAPAQLPRRQGARGDAGFLLQALGRLAGKRTTDDTIAGRFPGFARRLHHRRLAGAGAADHGGNPLRSGDMFDGGSLLIRQAIMPREDAASGPRP